ncbi:TPA_asm: hypothetical protein GEJ04_07835 [Listeria monocytogenes]|uniref:Uncharacterized protein n=1 Tax=Listeria monocytogenes TaxID=1639 RepID=A0A6W6GW23_LISMN|nr:hypothetical protein [Listeria monocytogenes]EAC8004038.1 hypothetical protein [Listeria monocytogenes]EAD5982823.1 hypothetical protein [Listeria monocytogenes]EAE1951363.1 hypothetical protein [Listeria monocytogenes]EAE2417803.1 hypothetical protein [Listeria monocytogenes]EAE2535041.1 hypothetical protein [Listeria monocytogenes]
MTLGSISIAGMSVGELIALVTLIAGIVGFVIRWALIAPLRNMIDSLDITLNSLREEMSESKKDRMSLREKQNNHDKEIALLKREDKAIWKYIAEKKDKKEEE